LKSLIFSFDFEKISSCSFNIYIWFVVPVRSVTSLIAVGLRKDETRSCGDIRITDSSYKY